MLRSPVCVGLRTAGERSINVQFEVSPSQPEASFEFPEMCTRGDPAEEEARTELCVRHKTLDCLRFMVLLKLIFLYPSVNQNLLNWTCWCRISSPLIVRQYSQYGSFHVQPWFWGFTPFHPHPPPILPHKLYIHHTWYMKNTDSHVQLLTKTAETHKLTRKKTKNNTSHPGRWTEALRSSSYLLCTSL